ncbi:hypothetical protein HY969_02910 [Candidatus Kaiserbacteria bacterium]|nr:hypothetical protein [Candidatus Kaiserbacteria bacterium]
MSKKTLNLQLPFRDRTFRRDSAFVRALPREESAIRFFGVLLAVSVFAYVFFVSLSIVNVIARKEADEQASQLRASVGQLEREYFALSGGVQANDGETIGLTAVRGANFIHRPGAVAKENVRNEI